LSSDAADFESMENSGGSTLFRNAIVLRPSDESLIDAATSDLRVVGDRIAAIEPRLEPQPGEHIVDASDTLIAPGMVNAHLHSSEAPLRGRYQNLPLELWILYACPLSAPPDVSAELNRLATTLVGIESLKDGVTTVVDDGPEMAMLDLSALRTVFNAYAEVGIRANCSGVVVSRPMIEALPGVADLDPEQREAFDAAWLPSADEYVDFAEQAIAELHGSADGRLRFLIAPLSPQWNTPEMLIAAAELSRKHQVHLHTHVLETVTQLENARLAYGCSLPSYLDQLGVLSPLTTIAHGIWLSRTDIDLLADRGVSVAHNPVANQKLGAGIAPLRALLDAGVNVGLGSDGISNSDTARMSDVVRSASLIHTVTGQHFTQWPTAREVLHAVSSGGAKSVSLGTTTGALEVGMKADLVLYDLNTIAFTPRNDLVKHLAFAENGSSIRQVYVDGRLVVEDGQVLTVDEEAVLRDVTEAYRAFRPLQDAAERAQSRFHEDFARLIDNSARSWRGPRLVP
jgi:5-methylthioadenosine/S-adenosylhomocysteine deaminase